MRPCAATGAGEVPLKIRPPLKRGSELVGVPPEAPVAAHIYFTFIINMNFDYVKYLNFHSQLKKLSERRSHS